MWQFRTRPTVSFDNWLASKVGDTGLTLAIKPGEWLITDGGHFDQSVSLGSILPGRLEIVASRLDGELVALEFTYPSLSRPSFDEIVIDSGRVVIGCRDAFVAQGVENRTSIQLLKWVDKESSRADLVAITDETETCVGLVATPPAGDGAYGIEFQNSDRQVSIRLAFESR